MTSAIIVAAGNGSRMGLNMNKARYIIGNKMVLMYSIDTFRTLVDEIILVISENDKDIINILPKDVKVVFGGNKRGISVYNGLKEAKYDYVLIHDAARPFISKDVIKEIISKKNDKEAILTYLDSVDTLRNKENMDLIERDKVIREATPQCANKEILLDAYNKSFADNKDFSDDISLLREYHPEIKINLIKANPEAFKLTYPIDLKLASIIWRDYD